MPRGSAVGLRRAGGRLLAHTHSRTQRRTGRGEGRGASSAHGPQAPPLAPREPTNPLCPLSFCAQDDGRPQARVAGWRRLRRPAAAGHPPEGIQASQPSYPLCRRRPDERAARPARAYPSERAFCRPGEWLLRRRFVVGGDPVLRDLRSLGGERRAVFGGGLVLVGCIRRPVSVLCTTGNCYFEQRLCCLGPGLRLAAHAPLYMCTGQCTRCVRATDTSAAMLNTPLGLPRLPIMHLCADISTTFARPPRAPPPVHHALMSGLHALGKQHKLLTKIDASLDKLIEAVTCLHVEIARLSPVAVKVWVGVGGGLTVIAFRGRVWAHCGGGAGGRPFGEWDRWGVLDARQLPERVPSWPAVLSLTFPAWLLYCPLPGPSEKGARSGPRS